MKGLCHVPYEAALHRLRLFFLSLLKNPYLPNPWGAAFPTLTYPGFAVIL